MKKIVILGSSLAGVKIIEDIRGKTKEDAITLVGFDGNYPCRRNLFPDFIAKGKSLKEISARPPEFYAQNNVTCILDKKISRINLNKRKIFFEDKTNVDFDILIMAETPENRFPDIKGTNKTGIFGIRKFEDIRQITQGLMLADTIAIQSEGLSGLKIAAAIAQKGKEVILVSPNSSLFRALNEESRVWLVGIFAENKIQLVLDNAISEVLGDAEAKAIKTKSGKVFACEIVIFTEAEEDLRLLADSGLQIDGKIIVDERQKTSVENVYACDTVSRNSSASPREDLIPTEVLEEQGKIIACAINGEEYAKKDHLFQEKIDIGAMAIEVIGDFKNAEAKVLSSFDTGKNMLQAVLVKENICVGAILINSPAEIKTRILSLIEEKKPLDVSEAPEAGDLGQILGIAEAVSAGGNVPGQEILDAKA